MYVVSGKARSRVVGFQEALRRLMVRYRATGVWLRSDRRQDDRTRRGLRRRLQLPRPEQGIKLSDEQGSYDRPHYLTVTFDQKKIDAALAGMGENRGSARAQVAVFLGVHRDPKSYIVDADDPRDELMRVSAGNASLLYRHADRLPV